MSAVALGVLMGAPGVAAAQARGETEVESVVVTASRIVRDGYEAPTPTTVVGIAEIQRQSPANVADYINQLPQLGGANFLSPRTTSYGVGSSGGNTFNTRNLGAPRTLTLLDGHRVVPGTLTGNVDVNLLPTNLAARVDVVTGGASAAWGSDAVAGVINFVLDKQFTGLKGHIGYGSSWLGDGTTVDADLAAGFKFADGRGHVLLSARMEDISPISKNSSRDWYVGHKAVANPARTATNNLPAFLAVDRAGLRLATSGGVITSGPLAGVQFGQNGAVLPYRMATLGSGIIGAGGDVEDIGGQYAILPEIDDQALFARIAYDLTDRLNAYVEIGRGWEDNINYTSHYIRHGDLLITADNPFIPAALNLQGQTSFRIGRVLNEPEFGPLKVLNTRNQQRYLVGLDGSADWFNDTFKWNAYYQTGKTRQYTELSHNPIIANFNRAVDAVANPAVGGVPGVAAGVPVCRSTLTNPTNGCQPFNVFGNGSPSLQARAYVLGENGWQNLHLQEDVAAAGVQFEPFNVPAGPVSVAGGVEWRKEKYHNAVDPLDAAAGPNDVPRWFGNYKLGRGEYSVKEGFVEVIAPIFKDQPLFQALDVNGAVRATDYSTSGRVTTWKYGVTWDVNDSLRFRGTRSRDIRAPNLNELFAPGSGAGLGVIDPRTGATVFVQNLGGGNPNLTPEIADTTAYGVVFRPSFLPGFSASIDRYEISIRDAITTVSNQQTVNLCFGANGQPPVPSACAAITLGPGGSLAGALVRSGGANIAEQNVSGYDIELSYRNDLATFHDALPGSIELRAVGSYLTEFSQTIGTTTTNFRNMPFNGGLPTAGGPNWRWLVTGTYIVGPSTTTVNMRYVGEGVINNEPLNGVFRVDNNKVKQKTYIDLNQSWSVDLFGSESQVFASIQNLFDVDPPKIPSTQGTAYASSGTDPGYYDLIGRFWRVGVRFKY